MSSPPLVLVTGVSGFIASWVAHGALKLGYRVRGTVRSLTNEAKIKHLRDLCPGSPFQVELVEANLTSADGWDAAVEGCDYILHMASPFPVDEPKDPEELIRPAVDGTLHVLRAASEMAVPPKRIVVTSSMAAVSYGTDPTDKVYSDNDWTVTDSKPFPISSYTKSKTLAEKAAWDFLETLPEKKKFELCTVNPSLVQGPMLSGSSCSSADIVKQIVMGQMQAIPDLHIDVVSVLTVARAHLKAMLIPEAAGKRFVLSQGNLSFRNVSDMICAEFRPYGYTPTTMGAPNWLVHVLAFFGDKGARSVAPTLGLRQQINPANARDILGLDMSPNPKVVLDMVYAAINAGIVPDKSSSKKISNDYVRPELDVSDIPAA